ncbi:ferrous iron transporter B [soil metagenome]
MSSASVQPLHVALVGNPNCGKTALFNRLTGSHQKVGNYAGVTVERKQGRYIAPSGRTVHVLDLPGAYSLDATSPDEAITRDVIHGTHSDENAPDVIVCVVDSTNLRLHLRFVLEVQQLGKPMVIALNMSDEAAKRGIRIDRAVLADLLGAPIVDTVAVRLHGAQSLVDRLDLEAPAPRVMPAHLLGRAADLHAETRRLLDLAVQMPTRTAAIDDRLDRIALHPVFGLVLLAAIMFLMFQAVYAWATPMMDGIDAATEWLGITVGDLLPDGMLKSLLVDGIIAGLGGVIVFLPQILILFLFILALEESGYLPRAAFLLDRFMLGAGLTGRSFIPLLSSFACAIPGIMATRTISDPRDRLTTILIAPVMTCSARLPVYALLIGAFVPDRPVLGLFNLQGLTLFVLYFAGIFGGLVLAFGIKRWGSRNQAVEPERSLLLELPSYRLPSPRNLALGLWERAMIFINRVGGIILALTVILWVLSSFPQPPEGYAEPAIDYSIAGRIGHLLEYVFAPIGFNWQICVALIPGLAAREVAVSSLATVYAIAASKDAAAEALGPIISAQWSVATAFSLLAWYVYAPQCLSTLAVMRRETNSWRTMLLAAFGLFALAYAASFVTYRVTLAFS